MTEQETPSNPTADDADDALTEQSADDAEQTERGEQPARASKAPWLLVLIILIVGAGGFYYWMETIYRPANDATAGQIAALEQQLGTLNGQLDNSGVALEDGLAAQAAIGQQVDKLASAQSNLDDAVKALYAKESQTSLDWILAEVEYLVFAANQRLALEGDAATASAALKAADHRLRTAEHPDLLGLREQLASDIAALDAVKLPDIEGLAIYLANASTQVANLPTRPIAELDMPLSTTTEEFDQKADWRTIAKGVWLDIKNLVEVKDGELEDGVLFDPKLRYFLEQNLRLELASARLSVMARDNANFRAAITLIVDLLDMYYDTDDGAVSSLMAKLKADQAIELAPSVPTISASLDAVRTKRADIRDAAVAGR